MLFLLIFEWENICILIILCWFLYFQNGKDRVHFIRLLKLETHCNSCMFIGMLNVCKRSISRYFSGYMKEEICVDLAILVGLWIYQNSKTTVDCIEYWKYKLTVTYMYFVWNWDVCKCIISRYFGWFLETAKCENEQRLLGFIIMKMEQTLVFISGFILCHYPVSYMLFHCFSFYNTLYMIWKTKEIT